MIDPLPIKIINCYGEFQPSIAEFSEIDFHERLPDVSRFDERFRILLVLDDLMNEADQNVCNLFTKLSHHRNVSITQKITQNFSPQKSLRPNDESKYALRDPLQESPRCQSGGDFGLTDVPQQE
jgi:hypothetical protein